MMEFFLSKVWLFVCGIAVTGVLLEVVVPSPSCPRLLSPQQLTEPSRPTAQVWPTPAETATAAVRPTTLTGALAKSIVPSPSWPWLLLPQQVTEPPTSRAQMWLLPDMDSPPSEPTDRATAWEMPDTVTGASP